MTHPIKKIKIGLLVRKCEHIINTWTRDWREAFFRRKIMKITYSEYAMAIATCEKIRNAFPELPKTTIIGTVENDADKALCALNQLICAYTSNSWISKTVYFEAMRVANKSWQAANYLAAPEFEIYEQNEEWVFVDTKAKRYGLKKIEGGWTRGQTFGVTIADAMRGAE